MSSFPSIRIEGGLLGPDILDQLIAGDLPGQRAADFGLIGKRNLTDEIAATFADSRALWGVFQHRLEKMPESDIATSVTRDAWMIPFLGLLGYEVRYNQRALEVDSLTFAISHRATEAEELGPIHIVGARQGLGRVPASGRPRLAPHSLVQEYLNRTEVLWGMVTNGFTLRLLRDCTFVRRQAYVEFDLQAILEEQRFLDFAALYRLLHRTRFPRGMDDAGECLLEKYYAHSVDQGGRVRDHLRDGVEDSLKILANAILQHPDNSKLREKWRRREFTPLEFYQQLLRLIYRLLFLMVAEERGLISDGATYRDYYSVSGLRRLAEYRVAYTEHSDLWLSLQTVFRVFQDESLATYLEVSPLNGDLFDDSHTELLNAVALANRDLLSALWHLSMYQDGQRAPWRRINYGALDVEELGSVYESLLDYQPVIVEEHGSIAFDLVSGTERKTTGSYYTPPELVNELIQSALLPVIEDRLNAATTAEQKEHALLDIKVCDPACGSGHFLLAAARRLAKELARVRTGEAEPTPEEQRTAMRQVIAHCIYGVDRNPLAVDLCKVALWIEGVAHGKPLSFIDHRIRRGDSLVGVFDLSMLNEGIPDEAFEAVAGDDRKVARFLKKTNRQERGGELLAGLEPGLELHQLSNAQNEFLELSDDDVRDVRRKAVYFEGTRGEGTKWWEHNMACHLWTAAFFEELIEDNESNHRIPTTASMCSYIENPKAVDARLVTAAMPLAERLRFFHWPLEFPEVFERGGFDVVLSNPPWERIKLQEKEFFAGRDPDIAHASTKAARVRLIRDLPQSNPNLWQEYRRALHDAECVSKFLRQSARFPLTARGDINTYAIFTELIRELTCGKGRAGLLVPTGIATDDTTKLFFGEVVETQSLARLIGFENEAFIFPAVHHAFKFCALTLTGSEQHIERAALAFYCRDFEDIHEAERRFELSREEIELISPNTRTCPTFRTRTDAELGKQIYRRVPVFLNEQTHENPWSLSFLRMVDMTNDSHLFRTREELEHGDYHPHDNRFVKDDETWLPLYEAKMMYHFDHRYGTYVGANQAQLNAGTLPRPSAEQKRDCSFVVQPRYWVGSEEVFLRSSLVPGGLIQAFRAKDEKMILQCIGSWLVGYHLNLGNEDVELHSIRQLFGSIFDSAVDAFNQWPANDDAKEMEARFPLTGADIDLIMMMADEPIAMAAALIESKCPKWFIGYRDITAAMVERTGVFVLLPRSAVGNTITLVRTPPAGGAALAACLLANLNALVLDFITRTKLTYIHLSFFVVKQLPVLPPAAYSSADIEFVSQRVLELVYTSWDMQSFAEDLGYAGEPFKWDEDRRALVRAELDAYYANLYGLTRDELRYILDPKEVYGEDFPGETFRVLKDKELRQFGEYRTKRMVLEAYDELVVATAEEAVAARASLKKPDEFSASEFAAIAYGANDRDKNICAAALSIVEGSGGLSSMDHLDALLLSTHPDWCKVFLNETERLPFERAVRSNASTFVVRIDESIRWKTCRDYLEKRGALSISRSDANQTISKGTAFDSVKNSLPGAVIGVVQYALRALERIRDLRQHLSQASRDEETVLSALEKDRGEQLSA